MTTTLTTFTDGTRRHRLVQRLVMAAAAGVIFATSLFGATAPAEAAVIGAYGPHALCNTRTHDVVIDPDFIRNPLPGTDGYNWAYGIQQWNQSSRSWKTIRTRYGTFRSDQRIGINLGGRTGYFRVVAGFTYYHHNAGRWVTWSTRLLPHVNGTGNLGYCYISGR